MKKITKRERKFIKNIPKKNEYTVTVGKVILFLLQFFVMTGTAVICELSGKPVLREPILWIVIFIISFPNFILLFNHFYFSPFIKIHFKTVDNSFLLTERNKEKRILCSEIKEIKVTKLRGHKNPFLGCNYFAIYLNNNEVVFISNLLINWQIFYSHVNVEKWSYHRVILPLMGR